MSCHHNVSVLKQLGVEAACDSSRGHPAGTRVCGSHCGGGQAMVLNKPLLLWCDTHREVHETGASVSEWRLDDGSSACTSLPREDSHFSDC